MSNFSIVSGAAFIGLLWAGAATAQNTESPSTLTSPVVTNPTYISIPLEIVVNRPVAEVWKRVGKFCDVGEWMRIPCTILSGKDGEIGTVRSVGREVLVGKTEFAYTYTQTVKPGQPYNLYHATLEARPLTPTTTKLLYTLMFDNSMLKDDAAREADKAAKIARFTQALENMKILAEGGVLPLAPRSGAQPSAVTGSGNN